jgi:hypothetical protein
VVDIQLVVGRHLRKLNQLTSRGKLIV